MFQKPANTCPYCLDPDEFLPEVHLLGKVEFIKCSTCGSVYAYDYDTREMRQATPVEQRVWRHEPGIQRFIATRGD